MDAPSSTQAAILQALTSGSAYGLELIHRVQVATAGLIVMRDGAVYPALRSLERAGLVRGCLSTQTQHGGRPRKHYELTATGRKLARSRGEALAAFFSNGVNRRPSRSVHPV